MITLYHGSNIFIEQIDLAQCNPYKDFGQAFYLTTDIVQAKDVANARVDIFGGEPVVNEFHFDESLLSNGNFPSSLSMHTPRNGRISFISIAMRQTFRLTCTVTMWFMVR